MFVKLLLDIIKLMFIWKRLPTKFLIISVLTGELPVFTVGF